MRAMSIAPVALCLALVLASVARDAAPPGDEVAGAFQAEPEANGSQWASATGEAASGRLRRRGDSPPLAWCTSGGGFRAMAAAMALSRAFDSAGLLKDPSLAAIASNSGSSWFLGQLAYSAKFHAAVMGKGESIGDVVAAWLDSYHSYLERQLGIAGTKLPALFSCLTLTGFPEAAGALALGARHFEPVTPGGSLQSWNDFVGGFLDEYTPGIAKVKANVPAKRHLPDLLFQMAFNPDSFLTGPSNSGSVLGTLGNSSGGMVVAPQPLQWVIPGRGCPLLQRPKFVMPSVPHYFRNLLSRQAFPAGSPEGNDEASRLLGGRLPTVAQVAGASSAAAGLVLASTFAMAGDLREAVVGSSQGKLRQCLEAVGLDAGFSCGDLVTEDQCATANGIVAVGLPEAAPCGGPLEGGRCIYPNLRISDGGAVDNMATAMTVAHLQKRFKNSALRLVLGDYSLCNNPPACDDLSSTENLKLIFSSEINAGVLPGDLIPLPDLASSSRSAPSQKQRGVSATFSERSHTAHPAFLSPQVFEMAYADLEFVSLGHVGSLNSTLLYANCTTRTVENEAFSVKGGTNISALIFRLVSTVPTDLYMSDFKEGTFNLYPPLAQGIFDAVDRSGVVKAWHSQTL